MTEALIAVLLLRLPLRRAFGARIAYLIWLLVPLALIGVMASSFAPMKALAPITLPIQVSAVRLPWSAVPTATSPSGQMNWIMASWTLGAVLFALIQWWQQHAFMRRLGELQPMPTGALISESAGIGPAVIGVLPPRIVLPADFYRRYTVPEQAFVLAHESMHIRRCDPFANFVAAIIRSLLWFHPLAHLAVRYFRIDQEFACDAAVLNVYSQDRHHYARAILKSQSGSPALPAGCRLESYAATDLKRRFLMLQTPLPSRSRRMLGVFFIAVSVIVSGGLAWAQTPEKLAQAPISATKVDTQYQVNMKVWEDGKLKYEPVIMTLAGRKAEMILDGAIRQYKIGIIAMPSPTTKGADSLSITFHTFETLDSPPFRTVSKASYDGTVPQQQPVRMGTLEVVVRAIERAP